MSTTVLSIAFNEDLGFDMFNSEIKKSLLIRIYTHITQFMKKPWFNFTSPPDKKQLAFSI